MTLRAAAEPFLTVEELRNYDCACITQQSPSDSELSDIIDQASDVIAIATGGTVFGRVSYTVLPCAEGGCWTGCACGCGLDGIPLYGPHPIITDVYIDDELIPSNEYRIHLTNLGPALVRVSVDGTHPDVWPRWQDLWKQGTGTHTFRFTITYGHYIDKIIHDAALEIACDLALDPRQRKQNALPVGTRSASQGRVDVSTQGRVREEAVARVKAGIYGPASARMMELYAPNGGQFAGVASPELSGGWTLHVLQDAS